MKTRKTRGVGSGRENKSGGGGESCIARTASFRLFASPCLALARSAAAFPPPPDLPTLERAGSGCGAGGGGGGAGAGPFSPSAAAAAFARSFARCFLSFSFSFLDKGLPPLASPPSSPSSPPAWTPAPSPKRSRPRSAAAAADALDSICAILSLCASVSDSAPPGSAPTGSAPAPAVTSTGLADANLATTRRVSLNVGLRVANGTLRTRSSPRAKHGSLPLPGLLSNRVLWSVLLAETKIRAQPFRTLRQSERHSRISSDKALSFARRMDDPADFIVLPPPASLVLCLPPALALTTYL
mmetsp:Transcript_13815/g.55951  ORF Transcript_13815/g.55951 Transcript_13815/m.55951 type:complete len:298 (-) Transcript_13815:856-1749(-)